MRLHQQSAVSSSCAIRCPIPQSRLGISNSRTTDLRFKRRPRLGTAGLDGTRPRSIGRFRRILRVQLTPLRFQELFWQTPSRSHCCQGMGIGFRRSLDWRYP